MMLAMEMFNNTTKVVMDDLIKKEMYAILHLPNRLYKIMGLSQINPKDLVSYDSPHQIPEILILLKATKACKFLLNCSSIFIG